MDKGFQTENLLAVDLGLAPARYSSSESRSEFYRRAIEETRAIPGVISAGMITALPLEGEGATNLITLDEKPTPLLERPLTGFRPVDPAFFHTMGIALRRGRIFDSSDGGRKVAVISERLAERVWPGQDPLGRTFRLGGESSPLIEVVGVVADIRAPACTRRLA